MFRALSVHLQEDTVVYIQHMVLSLCKQVSGRVLLKHDLLVLFFGPCIFNNEDKNKPVKCTS